MSRHIPLPIRCLLWGRSAGRCEFRGCNRDVTRNPITHEPVNVAQASHIIGFSEDGPRGEEELSVELASDVSNLMLLCSIDHKTIDTNEEEYPVSLLREMKREHEDRIALATGVDLNRGSHLLIYGARTGQHNTTFSFERCVPAISPDWYPAERNPLDIGMLKNTEIDDSSLYWEVQSKHLEQSIQSQVRPRIDNGDIQHLSVFGFAPQPLLIQLGYLLSDIVPAEVYQLHRKPADWIWQTKVKDVEYLINRPDTYGESPALIIGTTDAIVDERILSVLPDANIWRITIENPHNDFLKTRTQLQGFKDLIQPLLDEIKDAHGAAPIHIFPATAIAIAIEFGRCIQPKITPPLHIYDCPSIEDGFKHVITIG